MSAFVGNKQSITIQTPHRTELKVHLSFMEEEGLKN
jgi:hypothetical protein